jgi:hypothetical protein
LSRIIRELGFGKRRKKRCHQEPDQPGAEMQHDTSPYRVKFVNTTMWYKMEPSKKLGGGFWDTLIHRQKK